MRAVWLHKQNKTRLIIFFSGWATDSRPFAKTEASQFDVLMFYDYRDWALPTDFQLLFSHYQDVIVVGWSLGVWMGNKLLSRYKQQLSCAIAINGTLNPLDNYEGIPSSFLDENLKELTPINTLKFGRLMFSNTQHRKLFELNAPMRPLDERIEELNVIVQKAEFQSNSIYTHAMVAVGDLIFLPVNQLKAWTGKVDVKLLSGGHFPFYDFYTWDDLIDNALVKL